MKGVKYTDIAAPVKTTDLECDIKHFQNAESTKIKLLQYNINISAEIYQTTLGNINVTEGAEK